MKNANQATCSCCGADINAPQFYKGKAYGYTCIKKVDPSFKRKTKTGIWIKPDSVEIVQREGRALWDVSVVVKGIRFKLGHAYTEEGNNSFFVGGLLALYLPEHGYTFKSIEPRLNESTGKLESLASRGVVLWEA